MTRPRVLVVEDTEEIADVLASVLRAADMDVEIAGSGPDGLVRARDFEPDVVILDLNLPGMDGVEVCRQLRTTSSTYVLMLTARTDEVDRIVGLAVGADDYVTKPFSPREVQARVQALLRRPRTMAAGTESGPLAAVRRFGDLAIDIGSREVMLRGQHVALTKIEFDLLDALSENARLVLSRAQLRERVWGGDYLADDHAVDVHMSNLRRKLRAAGADTPIETVRGVGYRLRVS